MGKTVLMVIALAGVFAAGTACFGLFTRDEKAATPIAACAGLSGPAKQDCEQRR